MKWEEVRFVKSGVRWSVEQGECGRVGGVWQGRRGYGCKKWMRISGVNVLCGVGVFRWKTHNGEEEGKGGVDGETRNN